jgi:hypothetical protein
VDAIVDFQLQSNALPTVPSGVIDDVVPILPNVIRKSFSASGPT